MVVEMGHYLLLFRHQSEIFHRYYNRSLPVYVPSTATVMEPAAAIPAGRSRNQAEVLQKRSNIRAAILVRHHAAGWFIDAVADQRLYLLDRQRGSRTINCGDSITQSTCQNQIPFRQYPM